MPATAPATSIFDPDLAAIEELDEQIVSLTARMTAEEYALMVLIRTFDERAGWLKWGSASCADWLHWRCDLSLSAAREKVRVAHALKILPVVSAAFEAGRLSYSKVRALTRVANRDNEESLVEFALGVSASVVEQRCQQLRNASRESVGVARRAYEGRSLSAFRNSVRGVMTLTVEVPLEDGELVLNALDKALSTEPDAADASSSYRVRQADALVSVCRGVLAGDIGGRDERVSRASTADHYQVVVHVDAGALSHAVTRSGTCAHSCEPSTPNDPSAEGCTHVTNGARADLPIETVRRLCCDGSVVPIVDSADGGGSPVEIGRKQRTVPPALRRAVLARDKHCRFPGCTHERFVDAHHVQHWAHGGETTLDNLTLLCSHHHRLVHEGGFQIVMDHRGQPFFRRPDGRAVPACGYRPADRIDEDERFLSG